MVVDLFATFQSHSNLLNVCVLHHAQSVHKAYIIFNYLYTGKHNEDEDLIMGVTWRVDVWEEQSIYVGARWNL